MGDRYDSAVLRIVVDREKLHKRVRGSLVVSFLLPALWCLLGLLFQDIWIFFVASGILSIPLWLAVTWIPNRRDAAIRVTESEMIDLIISDDGPVLRGGVRIPWSDVDTIRVEGADMSNGKIYPEVTVAFRKSEQLLRTLEGCRRRGLFRRRSSVLHFNHDPITETERDRLVHNVGRVCRTNGAVFVYTERTPGALGATS